MINVTFPLNIISDLRLGLDIDTLLMLSDSFSIFLSTDEENKGFLEYLLYLTSNQQILLGNDNYFNLIENFYPYFIVGPGGIC